MNGKVVLLLVVLCSLIEGKLVLVSDLICCELIQLQVDFQTQREEKMVNKKFLRV